MPTLGTSVLPGICAFGARRRGFFAALVLLTAVCGALAEPVKIAFLPPPMEGTLSLGLYDTAGKLVRILHREAAPDELTKGDDGLETQWDGKDDQGKPCLPGTYRARGVMVGDLGVEGVDFIGNDWVDDDDSPRIRRIVNVAVSATGTPFIEATLLGQNNASFFSIRIQPSTTPDDDNEAQLVPEPQPLPIIVYKDRPRKFLKPGTFWTHAFSGTIWAIEGSQLRQYNATDKLVRTVTPASNDPAPVKLAASETEEKLYVLYENATLQRLRGYDFTGVKPGEEPKVLFEQDIHASDTYEQIASELQFPDENPFVPSLILTVALVPNPLFNNKPGSLQIQTNVDKEGCYLATADGLPLSHISDTRFLRWAVMGRPVGSKAITVFESDGAVVEQFQISNIANMMPFDAGEVQWTGESASPSPTPSPALAPATIPSATPAAPAKR